MALVVALGACGDDATPADAAVADSATQDGRAPAPDAGAGDSQAADSAAPDALPDGAVMVTYKGKGVAVDLSRPPAAIFEGTLHVKLSDVVQLALPAATLGTLGADFVAADGFRSGFEQSECAPLIPFPGSKFEMGYVDIVTHKLRWETFLNHPGCMYVKNLAEILLTDL